MAVELKENDRFVGYISLSREPGRVQLGDAEIGFRFAKRAWGKGYATEAGKAVVRRVRTAKSAKRIVAIVDPNNLRSVRVVTKLGMVMEGEIMLDGYDYPDRLYGLVVT
ncbi:MAG: GNAT family N-acetyltransferase [Pseudomonadota bacterium]